MRRGYIRGMDSVLSPSILRRQTMVPEAPERFFRGVVREPEGSGERVVIKKAARALAKSMAAREAKGLNWDWFVEHCAIEGSGDEQQVVVIEQWSSLAGHEILREDLLR